MDKTKKIPHQKIRSKQASKQEIKPEQTTKIETRPEQTKDFFAACKQNIEKYFDTVEKSIPKYYQTFNELQQEYLQLYENWIKGTISIQKESLGKIDLNAEQNNAATKIVSDITDSTIKAKAIRDEAILATIDNLKEAIKEWNNRSRSLVEMNWKTSPS